MTPSQYKDAADAISNFRWMLATALTSTGIDHTKESKARMKQLSELREALEEEGQRAAQQSKGDSHG